MGCVDEHVDDLATTDLGGMLDDYKRSCPAAHVPRLAFAPAAIATWPKVEHPVVKSYCRFTVPSSVRSAWRGSGSTFDTILPLAKRYHVAAMNWGLVAGKTQTYLPWDS
jgi:hypothetical protein